MEQVQMALDNVLNQSSVRNDVTMRIVRQQDKMKDLQSHVALLETHQMDVSRCLRQAEEKLSRLTQVQSNLDSYISSNSRNLKGSARTDLHRYSEQLSHLRHVPSRHSNRMCDVSNMVSHISTAARQGQSLVDSKPSTNVIDTISKLERLVGSDWHRFGRMLGLNVDCLDEIGKFTNFDLSTRVEKVMTTWTRTNNKSASAESLKQALAKMDRDISLLGEPPVSKDMSPVPPDVLAFFVAHAVDVSSLSHTLAWQGILSQESVGFILGVSEEYKRASRLIHCIVFMGQSALRSLCHVLDCSNQTHVAGKLKGCLPSESDNNTWDFQTTTQSPKTTLTPQQHHTNNNSNTPSNSKSKHPPPHNGTLLNSPTSQPNSSSNNNKHSTSGIISPSSSLSSSSSPHYPHNPHIQIEPPTTSSSSSSSSSHRNKSRDNNKTRTKRSRSLFTRKNKLRDTDMVETSNEPLPQDSYNHHDNRHNTKQPDAYYPVTVV